MASGPALSTAESGEILVRSEIRDSLSLLDVLYANQFEGESLDPKLLEQIEENFYRGAPPEWLNFYISEQAESDGPGTPIVKRDGYETLVKQIHQRRTRRGILSVKLFHQPGCGGTTLAMQVLWDLRKTFRCAVLTGSTSDITNVAKEVVHLFTAGSRGHQNTVLLLLNDEHILENLKNSIMEVIAERKIVTHMPVVILLSCIRKDAVQQSDHVVLQEVLSDTEKQKFNEKLEELSRRYSDKYKHLLGFNMMMQPSLSQAYIQEACAVFKTIRRTNKSLKLQLACFLSLLNAYVPGSYLLESQCLHFLKCKSLTLGDPSLEDRMTPFNHLIITFQEDIRSERRVRMAHPVVAQHCTELMAEAGLTRSEVARNFLTSLNRLCRDEIPPALLGFVKDMLTKRETKKEEGLVQSTEIKEDQERFSRLILDIQKMEGDAQSASLLEMATKKFDQNPFFPQALARYYYIELKDYDRAEMWAKTAKQRDPQNSFIADTLGQVHKNHLKSKKFPTKPREVLQLASKAIEAFKHEERLAENEHGADMKEDGMTKVSHVFNSRGQCGYLQVCNLVYDLLVRQNETWRRVLTNQVSMGSVLELLGDNKLYRFNELIISLRDEVKKKCAFLDKYLTYSKLDIMKDDPPYISKDISECYRKYVRGSPSKHLKQKGAESIQKLKENRVDTTAGVLSCLDREYSESELKQITTWLEEVFLHKRSVRALVKYTFAHIMLRNMGSVLPFDCKYLTQFKKKMPLSPNDAPEFHLLGLLLCWPTTSEDKCVFDLNQLIQNMHYSYRHAYKKYFRSRYLRPLFFIGKDEDLNRIVHRKVIEGLFLEQSEKTIQDWSNEKIFQDSKVQEHLLRFEGVVENYRVYATIGGTEIEVDANLRNSLWKPREVSFYLGFTIKGPVAFGIQTKTAEKGPSGRLKLGACGGVMNSSDWIKLQPEVNTVDEVHTYSLQSEAGRYECSVSGLCWVCKEDVSFRYQFSSWEEHMGKPSCMDYMPGGPLLDITVTAGKIEEVHLPHWIDYDSTMSDLFAVLHVDTCGDFVERVAEVTSSHVKLLQPVFSPRGVMILMKLGFPVKVFYDVLIYKTIKTALTLHVYLVPPDPVLQQAVKREEESDGSRRIRKPSPDESFQMETQFFLSADSDTAEICPHKLKLTWERRNPNFFEVFIRNANSDFGLELQSELKRNKGKDTVWSCTIRTEDYQNRSICREQGQHFVERHRTSLINRVSDTAAILDELKDRELISNETYDTVRALKTTQKQMREILRFVISAGQKGKDTLYEILTGMKNLRPLVAELEEN